MICTMEDKAPTRFWPARWAKKEAFWEALAVQTSGTILAALLIGVFLSIVGIGNYSPAVRYYTSQAVLFILTVAVLGVIFWGFMRIFRFRLHRRRAGIRTYILLSGGFGVCTFLMMMFIIFVIQGPVDAALQEWYGYPPSQP